MILEVGFLDHYKTKRLVRLADGNREVIFALIRLWEHCQVRRRWVFVGLSADDLETICEFPNVKPLLEKAGFIHNGQANTVIVHDWEKTNRLLVSAWENGVSGGRPKKQKNRPVTDGIPTANRRQTDPSPLSVLSTEISSLTVQVQEKYRVWIHQRMSHHKIKDWVTLFREQISWLKTFPETDQLLILSTAIMGRHQGLFPPKHRPSGPAPPPKRQSEADRLFDLEFPEKYRAAQQRKAERDKLCQQQ